MRMFGAGGYVWMGVVREFSKWTTIGWGDL